MTEEELEQKAEEYGQENKFELVEQSDLGMLERAFKDGYKEGQKENAELKKDLQIAIDANKKWLQRDTQLEEENVELKAQIEKLEGQLEEKNLFIKQTRKEK